MLSLVLSPKWFLGPDILIDFFSFFVLMIFAFLSFRYYRLSQNKKFIYLSLAFLLVGLGEISKIVMNLGLYYNLKSTYEIGRIIVTANVVKSVETVYRVGFFLNKLLILLGFYSLYYTTRKKHSWFNLIAVLYFIVISALFTDLTYYLFNITITILVAIMLIYYLNNYKERGSGNARTLSWAFSILVISYATMIFAKINSNAYIVANLFQLASYILLLYLIISIYKQNGKKK